MRCYLIILLLVPAVLCGQNLVKPDELTFNSPAEEKAILSHLQGHTDLFVLFTFVEESVDPMLMETYRERYEAGIENIRFDRLRKKKPAIMIDRIYRSIHDEFFTQYEERNYFNRIFENGHYNCVSATAFYGMVFTDLGIPFTVRENPTHVYIVAYPETEKLMVESTAPGLGAMLYSETFKKNFVKKLAENKLIPADKLNELALNDLFDEYYFNDEDVNMTQLVGIQYMNDAIYQIDQDEFQRAWQQSQKAWLFYPGQKCAYLMLNIGITILNEGDYYSNPEKLDILLALTRFGEYGISNEMILGELRKIMDDVLIERNDTQQMGAIYDRLITEIVDAELRSDISFAYNYERARLLFNLSRFRENLPFIEEASRVKPEHLQAQGLLSATIIRLADNEADPLKRSQFLEEKIKIFPNLSESAGVMSLMASSFLEESSRNFKFSDPQAGNFWLDRFEEFKNRETDLNISTSVITDAYSDAAVYYFRKGNKAMAIKLLERGLIISPGNFELEQRLRAIR